MKNTIDKKELLTQHTQAQAGQFSTRKERQVLITKEEDGGYSATVPSLPGCTSQGETLEETIANIREAIELHLEGYEERGWSIPEEHNSVIIINL